MTKRFLITLDKDKGKESQNKSDIIEQDDEKVNNAKDSDEKDLDTKVEGMKPKGTTTDEKKAGNDYSFAIDYSSHLHSARKPKQSSSRMVKTAVGQDYSGGMYYSAQQLARGGNSPTPYGASRWECRYKRSSR